MRNLRERLERFVPTLAVTSVVFLAGATATAVAQSHGPAGGGAMRGWGTVGGWMLWPILLLGLLALVVVWAGSRSGSQTTRTDNADRALETLRERYARGDLSDEEFERRRRKLRTQR